MTATAAAGQTSTAAAGTVTAVAGQTSTAAATAQTATAVATQSTATAAAGLTQTQGPTATAHATQTQVAGTATGFATQTQIAGTAVASTATAVSAGRTATAVAIVTATAVATAQTATAVATGITATARAGLTQTVIAGYTFTNTPTVTPTPTDPVQGNLPPRLSAASGAGATPVPGNTCESGAIPVPGAGPTPTPGVINLECSDLGYWYKVKVYKAEKVNVYIYGPGNSGAVAATYLDSAVCPGIFQPQPGNAVDPFNTGKLFGTSTQFTTTVNSLTVYLPRNDTLDQVGFHQWDKVATVYQGDKLAYPAPGVTQFKLFQPGPNRGAVLDRREIDTTGNDGISGYTDLPPTVVPGNCGGTVQTYAGPTPANPAVQIPTPPAPSSYSSAETAGTPIPAAGGRQYGSNNSAFVWQYLGTIDTTGLGIAPTSQNPATYYVQVYVHTNGPVSDHSGNTPFQPGDVYNSVVHNFAIGAFPQTAYITHSGATVPQYACPLCSNDPSVATGHPVVSDYPPPGGSQPSFNAGANIGPNNYPNSLNGEAPPKQNLGTCVFPTTPSQNNLCTTGELSAGTPYECTADSGITFIAPSTTGTCPTPGPPSIIYSQDPDWPIVSGDGTVSNYVPSIAGTPQPSNTPTSTPTTVALPGSWQSAEVGGASGDGTSLYGAPTSPNINPVYFNITDSASVAPGGIGAFPTKYQYAFQTLQGDGTIIARVASQNGSPSSAKAGILITNGISGRDSYASELITPASTPVPSFSYDTSGVPTSAGTGCASTCPVAVWVKLVRLGSTITGFNSVDGQTWTQDGSTYFPPGAAYMGLASTNTASGITNLAQFDNIQTIGSLIAPANLAGWSETDMGTGNGPPAPPTATRNGSSFIVNGKGTPSVASVNGHYLYQSVGPGTKIVAHLNPITCATLCTNSLAGILLMQSVGGSPWLTMATTKANTTQMVSSGGTNTPVSGSPRWVEIDYNSDSTVTVQSSTDGITWNTVSTNALAGLSGNVDVGLAVTSASGILETATEPFDSVSISALASLSTQTPTLTPTTVPTITPTSTPPTGSSLVPLGEVPSKYAGSSLYIDMFDPGDVVDCNHPGSAWFEIVPPNDTNGNAVAPVPFTYTVTSDSPGYAGYKDPANPAATAVLPAYGSSISDIRGQNAVQVSDHGQVLFNNSWVHIVVQIPATNYHGGTWKFRYVLYGPTKSTDRMTIQLRVGKAPVFLVQ